MHPGDAIVNSAAANYISTIWTYAIEKHLGMGRILKKFGKPGRRFAGTSFANNILNTPVITPIVNTIVITIALVIASVNFVICDVGVFISLIIYMYIQKKNVRFI